MFIIHICDIFKITAMEPVEVTFKFKNQSHVSNVTSVLLMLHDLM